MTEHGIFTSEAYIWIHLFPLEKWVYWYPAACMREFILIEKIPTTNGLSLDQSPTGVGYLIPKLSPYRLVSGACVSDYFKDDQFDWAETTQREAGRRGQLVVELMLTHGAIKIPNYRVERENSLAEQIKGYDGHIHYFADIKYETKCERYKDSPNLFVQRGENGHKATLGRDANGNLFERSTKLVG
jgi:hypothetical protein